MENQDLRDEILDNIPYLPELFWTYLDSSEQEMKNITHRYINTALKSADPMALTKRSKGFEGIYEIYVNPNVPDACKAPLDLHERGHIIFTHMSLAKAQRDIILQKIMTHWDTIKKYLDDDILKGINEADIAKEICKMILNIAMDYEVNSKLYTDTEWEKMVEYTQWAYVTALAYAPKSTKKQLDKAIKYVNNPSKLNLIFKPCHPSTVGFKSGLDYRQYIDLILMQPSRFMASLISDLKGNGENCKNNGENGNESKDSDGKLSREDIDKLREISDTDVEKNQELEESLINTHSWEYGKTDKKVLEKNELYITQNAELERRILKGIYNKNIYNTYNDPLHFYNRNKYNTDIMVNYEKKEDMYVPGNIYLLVDCSGSIGRNTIGIIVGTIKKIAKKCGPKSRIIWWSDILNSDTLLRESVANPGGGYTDISAGINYVKSHYLKNKNDKFIIISDYEDTLSYWMDELETIKNDCLGICWRTVNGYNSELSNDDFIKKMGWCTEDSDDGFKKKFLEKLPTEFVWIPESFDKLR